MKKFHRVLNLFIEPITKGTSSWTEADMEVAIPVVAVLLTIAAIIYNW